MKEFLEKIRKPKTGIPLKRQLAATVGIILLGVTLGVLQKWLDATAANTLPLLLQRLDIGNYFGRLAIWILIGTAISVYAASPLRIWVLMSFASFFLAMVCWYAKGEGAPAVLLSAVILGALLAQAVNLRIDRGFYVYHLMEVFTWLAGVLLLRRRGKEFAVEMGLSVVVAVLYQLILPHWG